MKKIGIIGFGALSEQMLGLLSTVPSPEQILFFDDVLHGQGAENSFPFDRFVEARFADFEFYVGLGYRHLPRKVEIFRQLRTAGRRMPALVRPSSQVHPTCRLGDGCLVYPLCNVGQEVELGAGVLLNNSVLVSHNSLIGGRRVSRPRRRALRPRHGWCGGEGRFEQAGIRLLFKSYEGYPEYPQLRPPFEHAVSILDVLANVELADCRRCITAVQPG